MIQIDYLKEFMTYSFFVQYANTNNFPCELTILFFDGKICTNYPKVSSKLLDYILNNFNSKI